MSDNNVLLIDQIILQKKEETGLDLNNDDFFEYYCLDQILKDFNLSYEQLISGNIGGRGDGGIDGFFLFLNDEYIDEDIDDKEVQKNPLLRVYIFQVKNTDSFAETPIDKVTMTLNIIFDFSKDVKSLEKTFNGNLVEKARLFRNLYMKIASKHPTIDFKFFYITKGDIVKINPPIKTKMETLEKNMKNCFQNSKIKGFFIGAVEILDQFRREPDFTLQLEFSENVISSGESNYILLASLRDYFNFFTDENGDLRRYLFDSNVRDYQGRAVANKDIEKTLNSDDPIDFWWLNNGITILATKASIVGKKISLDNVQIVNGLQTTETIFNYMKEDSYDSNNKDKKRCILIRIIITSDSETRDKIIKATNFQTPIPIASLRAMDKIQRDIEDFLLKYDYFYDRRKSHYKNLGKKVEKIITISDLAQIVMSIKLQKPDFARAKPSSLIKTDEDYKKVFDQNLDLNIYLVCLKISKKIDNHIKNRKVGYERNFKFHLSMLITMKMLGKKEYVPTDLLEIDVENITEDIVGSVSKWLYQEIMTFIQSRAKEEPLPKKTKSSLVFDDIAKIFNTERVAKSREFVEQIIEKFHV